MKFENLENAMSIIDEETLRRARQQPQPIIRFTEGPTLRDQFAMAALTGLLVALAGDNEATILRIPQAAYEYADQMLLARSASKEDKPE